MRRLHPSALAFMSVLAASGAPAVAGPDIKPGLWEITVESQAQGMPMNVPPVTRRECLTEKDLVPPTERPGQDCRVEQQEISGDTVSWRVSCDNSGMKMTGAGKITYAGDTYQGTMNMQMAGGPMGPITMSQKIRGRRIGDCK